MKNSKIEWTDHTWNGWIGCTRVSPACDNCYAAVSTPARTKGVVWGAKMPRVRTAPGTWSQMRTWNDQPFGQCKACGWRGPVRNAVAEAGGHSCPSCLVGVVTAARARVFCSSLCDVFDNEVPLEWLVEALEEFRRTPNIDKLLLTKRIGNVERMLGEAVGFLELSDKGRDMMELWHWLSDWLDGRPPADVWLGATICNQEEADRDIAKLLDTPAAVRFLSMEPLLGPVDLVMRGLLQGVDWVIVGGESGHNARPMPANWARHLRDQCAAAGVPFLFKQWGEWAPASDDGFQPSTLGAMERVGKKAAGRLLDGQLHDGYPRDT